MLESVYIFMSAFAAVLILLALFQGSRYPSISLLAVLLTGSLAMVSAEVEVPFCEYSGTWTCTTYQQTGNITGLIYMWGGLSTLMFLIFFIDVLDTSLSRAIRRQGGRE